MMKLSYWNSCFLVLIFLAQAVTFSRTDDTCDVARCLTQTCDADGNCLCLSPAQVAANNGLFLGGQFCNQTSHYCNPETSTDSFYCVDNGGNTTCAVVNGASACVCLLGYAGDKCQYSGIACGVGYYCYNNGTCVNGATCDCPIDWQGNANCTLASPEADSSGGHGVKWWGVLLIIGAVVAVVSVGAIFGMIKYKERMEGVNRFNELKKSQTRGRAESDDDEYDSDPYEDEVARNNRRSAPPPPAQQPQP